MLRNQDIYTWEHFDTLSPGEFDALMKRISESKILKSLWITLSRSDHSKEIKRDQELEKINKLLHAILNNTSLTYINCDFRITFDYDRNTHGLFLMLQFRNEVLEQINNILTSVNVKDAIDEAANKLALFTKWVYWGTQENPDHLERSEIDVTKLKNLQQIYQSYKEKLLQHWCNTALLILPTSADQAIHMMTYLPTDNPQFNQVRLNIFKKINGTGELPQSTFNPNKIITDKALNTIFLLNKFKNDTLTKADNHHYEEAYKKSTTDFYNKSVDIMLSDEIANDKKEDELRKLAHETFHHRHPARRFLKDALMVIGFAFMGATFFYGLYRRSHNKTFFFSTEETGRYKKLDNTVLKTFSKK